jgi:Sigma-70, region 4
MRESLAAVRHLEQAVLGARWTEGIVLRYGTFYGPGIGIAPGGELYELVRRRRFPLVGGGGGVWSYIHIADAAEATVAAVIHGRRGVYNVVDDDPAPVAEWLPALAQTLGARKPMRVPRFVGRLLAGEVGVMMLTELRSASNAKAKHELWVAPGAPELAAGVRSGMTGREELLDELRPDSFAIAMLVLLESLSPEQRAVLLLHEVFDYSYPEIAAILGKRADNVRQLASRARRHLQQRRPRFQPTHQHRDELARRFLAAAEHGDLAGLEALLAHDVELTADGGGKVPALARSLRRRTRVARTLINWGRLVARVPAVSLRLVEVNGGPGALFVDAQQRLIGVVALGITGGQVTSISAIVNPDKLRHLGPVADYRSLPGSAR